MFRGYQVRNTGKIQKFEEKIDEIVNNKFEPKVQEPSEFGTELVGKIQDFKENNEILDDSEEIIEDMETKFEKFGEIMRKIEESNEKVDENPESAVDGNVTENAKDEDFIDILLDEPNQESKSRANRSISPETGEIIENLLEIEPEDSWTEDFDVLKVTKIQEITASKAIQHENLSSVPKKIEDPSTTLKNIDNVDPKDSSIQGGIDEVDTNVDGQDSRPPNNDLADNLHQSYSDDEKVRSKDSTEHVTILDNVEQTKCENDDELIEAQTENYEGKEVTKINEIVTRVDESTENVNKIINSDVESDTNDSENVNINSIKLKEESKDNFEESSKTGHENPTNIENSDAIKQFNEEHFDKTTDEVTEDDKSGENLETSFNMLENVQNNIKNDDIKLDNSSIKQPEDLGILNTSNDLNYQVFSSPPTDSPGSSENEENFDKIVQNLSENLSENDEVELNFENIADDVENFDENVKKFDDNSKSFGNKIDHSLENLNKNDENLNNNQQNFDGTSNKFDINEDTAIKIQKDSTGTQDKNSVEPENTHKNAQIFDKYLDIYDENLENFEYFTNNPDGTLKKSHKIVEKLNEIVEDELAKYVEKMDVDVDGIESNDKKSITGLMTENEDSGQPMNIEGDAQFDIFEYAVPSDDVEADAAKKLTDEPQSSSIGSLNDEQKSDNENLTQNTEIIEETITKQEIKPQLSENIPIPHQNNSKNQTKPEKLSDEIEDAAVKIQSFFRGFKVRKSSKPKKKSQDPSIFGIELVDKIQEFEVKSEILEENSDEVVEDMETKFEKFGEIMKKIEESNEKVEEFDEKVDIQGDPVSKSVEENAENSDSNSQNLASKEPNLKIPDENLILKASIPKQNQEADASNPEEPEVPQKLIPTERILNPLQGFENLSKKFEHKLEENSAEQAAVKIQSLFRGFKVRKSSPPRKYKQIIKEPSAFGSELLDKIEEFEEKDEKSEEKIEDMETKFEKFGEIMRKIEESENIVDDSQTENEERFSKIQQESEIIMDQNQPKNGSNDINHTNLDEIDEKSTKFEENLLLSSDDRNSKNREPTSQNASKTSDDTEQANAAVKIQSFFRGFKVRKSNQKKIQEPSAFGSELIEKIQDFEENNENSEEIVENMEEKFEKFGEIMRKIEESEENLNEKINIQVENSDLKNEKFAETERNVEILNEKIPNSDKNSTKNESFTDSNDVKPEKDVTPQPVPSAPMEDSTQITDDETSAAVKIQSFFRGFKVRKSRKPKEQEPSAFGNELVDKIQDFESKNEGSDEYVEDMEAKFEKFGEIMKKIEESGGKLEDFNEEPKNLDENSRNLDENQKNFAKSAEKVHENQLNLTENPQSPKTNPQNLSQSPSTPPPTPEDSPNNPQQKLIPEADQVSDEYEEVDQLSTIYEQNSVEEEPCIEKIVSKCGPDLEQNVNDLNEEVICGQEENSIKIVETENEKLIGKPHKKVKNQNDQQTIKEVDFKSQKFVKIGDKFVIVDENPENLKDSPKTDNEVLENLAKSTEKLSRFSEKLSKSPAKNSNFEETSEKFEDISKQFDQISEEYDKLYKKIEEKFEENSGIIQKKDEKFVEKLKIIDKNQNFDENTESPTKNDPKLTKIEIQQNEATFNQVEIKRDPDAPQTEDQNDESEQAKAAVKIQSTFRGYKVRKSRFQKFKEDLSEKFNKKSEKRVEEPSIFGSELMEKIKDFEENEDDSEEVVENMETKFEKFGEIMRKIEESGENEVELNEKVRIQGGNFKENMENSENFMNLDDNEQGSNISNTNLDTNYLIQENIDEFDMDSLEYEANSQNMDHSSQMNQKSNDNPPKLEENAGKSINLNENVSENDNFPEKITQKPSKIPIKQKSQEKSQINPENLLDHPQKIPSDPKAINKLSHSTDHTPLLSPNHSDPNLLRRQSYIDSVIHEIEGSHVIEGGLYGYCEQFDDLQAANPEILGKSVELDADNGSEIENVEVVQKIQQISDEISQNPKENFDKIDEKVNQNSPNPIKTYSFFSRNPTIPSSSHQKIIPVAKVQPENIKALTSKAQEKLELEPRQITIPSQAKQMKNSMMRQKTMPVQIESSVMRVLPKHLKKR